MDTNSMKLRTAPFGGFNKQDVIAYIEKTKNEAYEEKSRLQKQIKELNEKVADLEGKVASFDEEKDMLVRKIGELSVSGENKNETVEEINEATSHLKSVADELCQSLRDFMQRISENSCSVVIEGTENEDEEEFDSEKFMAELEAEIYAKLGVEETDKAEEESETEEIAEETEKTECCEKTCDKVSAILSSLSAFSTDEGRREESTEEVQEDTTVSDILGSLSFLK